MGFWTFCVDFLFLVLLNLSDNIMDFSNSNIFSSALRDRNIYGSFFETEVAFYVRVMSVSQKAFWRLNPSDVSSDHNLYRFLKNFQNIFKPKKSINFGTGFFWNTVFQSSKMILWAFGCWQFEKKLCFFCLSRTIFCRILFLASLNLFDLEDSSKIRKRTPIWFSLSH